MINDKKIRSICIPLIGILIPFISGFYNYHQLSFINLLIANSYSIIISFCVWHGSVWVLQKFRNSVSSNTFIKIITLCFINVLYASAVASVLCAAWLWINTQTIDWVLILQNTLVVCIATIVFTLVYEILFLTTENRLEHIKTSQLDKALTTAQLTLLKNELDPHFMYNALNSLSWLVQKDAFKADHFIMELSEVYKYFLVNKNKKNVTLHEEIDFIHKYFALLQLRYGNKIFLITDLQDYDTNRITILPCALQLLVENAIKHNSFSIDEPLSIKIAIKGENIYVTNTKRPNGVPRYSTKIGLNNLKERYQLICNQPIVIESGFDYFMVSLPLLKTA